MPKSLEMKSGGLDFDRFMKALVQVPKQAIDKALGKRARKRKQATSSKPAR
jgi:hypothetical protein